MISNTKKFRYCSEVHKIKSTRKSILLPLIDFSINSRENLLKMLIFQRYVHTMESDPYILTYSDWKVGCFSPCVEFLLDNKNKRPLSEWKTTSWNHSNGISRHILVLLDQKWFMEAETHPNGIWSWRSISFWPEKLALF